MNFLELVSDIEKLRGKKLRSIKSGAEITIEDIDRNNERIILTTTKGKKKPRPLSELRLLWERLCTSAAIHVESTLGCSGSSRNQPETILANLPYIEWLKYENRKHLALVGKATHEFATIKQMDGVDAERVKKRLREGVASELSTVVVVASDVREAAQNLEAATGLKLEALESGVYKRDHSNSRIFIVAQSSLPAGIEPGTYAVIRGTSVPADTIPLKLGEQTLHPLISGGMNIMVLQPNE